MWSQEMGWLMLARVGSSHSVAITTGVPEQHETCRITELFTVLMMPTCITQHSEGSINDFTWVCSHKGLDKFRSPQSHIFHNPFPTQPHSCLWQPTSQNRQWNIIFSTRTHTHTHIHTHKPVSKCMSIQLGVSPSNPIFIRALSILWYVTPSISSGKVPRWITHSLSELQNTS